MKQLQRFLSRNWFISLLWVALLTAYFLPQIGNSLSARLPVNLLLTILIFFCIGLTMPGETLRKNLSDWRFYLPAQIYIFVLYPLVFLLLLQPLRFLIAPEILLGFIALSVLPTSVSGAVLFSRESGGDETLATVNALLANILGPFLTPLLISFIISLGSSWFLPPLGMLAVVGGDSVQDLFFRLGREVFLPLILGYLVRHIAPDPVQKRHELFSVVNCLAVVLIVFFSFSRAAGQENFVSTLKSSPLPLLFLSLVQPLMLLLAWLQGRLLRFERPRCITMAFTGSQKTAAMGVPLLSNLFRDYPGLDLVLFPLLFYHSWQYIVAGVARHYFQRGNSGLAKELARPDTEE
ncbi:bile acid:sodium symporter [Candidatus Haliotispira prima]|uniref:Bile acid:sodium symporter n=1 Tax=Candidatus Haliotispira prima TaxID=3034016 RepID=A0ABY8MJE2_9SPIO|nr:bile acid:sodium symporter [Candidatus Haliotispira prima]